MLRLKDATVITDGTTRELWFGLGICEHIYAAIGFDCVVTSLEDGDHKQNSLHLKGKAADLRVKQITDATVRLKLFQDVKAALKPYGFDVIPEGGVAGAADENTSLTTGAHIHIEFDPKAGQPSLTL